MNRWVHYSLQAASCLIDCKRRLSLCRRCRTHFYLRKQGLHEDTACCFLCTLKLLNQLANFNHIQKRGRCLWDNAPTDLFLTEQTKQNSSPAQKEGKPNQTPLKREREEECLYLFLLACGWLADQVILISHLARTRSVEELWAIVFYESLFTSWCPRLQWKTFSQAQNPPNSQQG